MSKAKKVIFVIVEGPTEEDALSSVLKQIFSSAEVHFHVIHGDITTEDAITANNAKSYVAKRIAAEMKKYAYVLGYHVVSSRDEPPKRQVLRTKNNIVRPDSREG